MAEIYNDSVLTHFKPTLERKEKEFCETLCSGLKYLSEYRYIIEDNVFKKAYKTIKMFQSH